MNKASEYAMDFGIMKNSEPKPMGLILYRDAHMKTQKDLLMAIKRAQKDAIEATLIEVSNISSTEEHYHLAEIQSKLFKELE